MAGKLHIWKEDTTRIGDVCTISATIESPFIQRQRIWYQLPMAFEPYLTDSCDAFLIAIIFAAMKEASDVFVHGELSPSLLQNLAEFQAAWSCWKPEKYRQIEISAETEKEPASQSHTQGAVAAFTGGIDSCFTVLRHQRGLCDRHWRRDIKAGLMVHGFDIFLNQINVFKTVSERARATLSSLNVELITIATNCKTFLPEWEDTHVAGLASCFTLLSGLYAEGLIASGRSYGNLFLPWGSNPITDPFFSSKNFHIVHDGASYTREQKTKIVASWPEACESLRVCNAPQERVGNCGRCHKCIKTWLLFRLGGINPPSCLPADFSEEHILSTEANQDEDFAEYIRNKAIEIGVQAPWVDALNRQLASNAIEEPEPEPVTGRWHRYFDYAYSLAKRFQSILQPNLSLAAGSAASDNNSNAPEMSFSAGFDQSVVDTIKQSQLFDEDWYLEQYPDLAGAGIKPLTHYVFHGAMEGRDPNPYFHSSWYLRQYPDVARAGLNPLFHYIHHGAKEGRDPYPSFQSDWYLHKYPDPIDLGMNPLLYFIARKSSK